MPSTRLSAWNVRPAAVTVFRSTMVARALSTYSTSSCSLVCQFMNACALPRPARNSRTISRMLARDGVELGEEQLVGEPAHPVQLLGRLGEQVVRHAGLVRAGATEERPAVDDQRAAAHGPHVGRAEPAAGPAADEDRVVARVLVPGPGSAAARSPGRRASARSARSTRRGSGAGHECPRAHRPFSPVRSSIGHRRRARPCPAGTKMRLQGLAHLGGGLAHVAQLGERGGPAEVAQPAVG